MRRATLGELLESQVSGYWGADAGAGKCDVLLVRNGDVIASGAVRWSQLPVRSLSTNEVGKAVVHQGDLLMTISGYCGQVAHVEVEPNVTTCVSNFVKRLRVRSEIADSRFVFHQMNTDAFRAALSPFIRGTTMQNLSLKDAMSRVELTLPSIDEQRRIAAILDKADEVRAKRRAALETLETLSQAVFIDMFGEISPSWPLVSIESLASTVPGAIRTGPFGSQLLHSEFVDSGIAVLGIDNAVQDHFAWAKPRFITNEKYESLKRFTVRPGDVLVTIMGTCGRSAIVPDDMPVAINTKHLCCITLDQTKCLPTFLAASFRNDGRLRRQLGAEARGAVMPGLNMGLIRATRLYLPPIELQARFARRMDEVGDQEYTQTEHATAIDNLFASLQQRAFQGAL